MSTGSDFSAISSEVVGHFLQSAVIVDDQPYFEDLPQTVVVPGRGSRAQARSEAESPKRSEAARHDLDARRLINAFAELGVVCAVLQPIFRPVAGENGDTLDSLSARTDRATQRADIVILDWNMRPENRPGQKAMHLIKEILRTDKPSDAIPREDDHSRRLRLIAIYTGDDNLALIKDQIKELLAALDLGDVTSGPYHVTAGPVTVTVYGKGSPTITGEDASRRVGEEELPRCLQSDFTRMTKGLLSNAALAALSAIRTNTHRLLSRFNPGMDAPYVAHRAMMEPPEEAEEHPIPLITAEVEGVLADDIRISKLVGMEAIKAWLESIGLRDEVLQEEFKMESSTFRTALLSLLEQGLIRSDGGAEFSQWKSLVEKLKSYDRSSASSLTKVLAAGEADGNLLDMKFALLTSMRTRYEEPPPILMLGTIVAADDSHQTRYWLCVQPVCDSLRFSDSRDFPFLRLKVKDPAGVEPFDFVVFDEFRKKYQGLRCSRKAFDMILFKMRPDKDSKSVRGNLKDGHWFFIRSGKDSPLRWIADLKTDHAHRIVDLFANEIKRVGLTESEWLRRMAIQPQSLS